MGSASEPDMQAELDKLREENERLQSRLEQATALPAENGQAAQVPAGQHSQGSWEAGLHPLTTQQIARYSRQLLLPSFGLQAQARLLASAVLIVGAGGLGSPAALYLTAAGAGRIGIVDQDVVELNNLHRQIIHSERRVGRHKAESAATACQELNSTNKVEVHKQAFTPQNALELVSQYDVVLDCTDNAPSRYLISDSCVVAGKPLVSGAAIGTDGQLSVYNHGEDGPCYRCLFPVAPQAESCSRCSEAGVLGVIPGIIGSLQALEAIKILAGVGQVASRKLVIFDGLAMRFHTVKLRARMSNCIACGPNPAITAESLPAYSYTDFTGQPADDTGPAELQLLPEEQRLDALRLADRLHDSTAVPLVLDVRPRREFELAHLSGSVNYPFDEAQHHLAEMVRQCKLSASSSKSFQTSNRQRVAHEQDNSPVQHQPDKKLTAQDQNDAPVAHEQDCTWAQALHQGSHSSPSEAGVEADPAGSANADVIVVCRRGNDSQHVVQLLRAHGITKAVDLIGGLTAWSRQADPSFPEY